MMDSVKECGNQIKIINQNLINVKDFIDQLNNVNSTLKVKYGDIGGITPDDIMALIEMARRNHEFHTIWSPRKKVFLWLGGSVLLIFSIISGINTFIFLLTKFGIIGK